MRRKKAQKVYMKRNKTGRAVHAESKVTGGSTRRQSITLQVPRRQSTVAHSIRMKTHVGLGTHLPKVFPEIAMSSSMPPFVLRKHLQLVSGANAVLSWTLSVIGYFDVADLDESEGVNSASRDAIRSLVCGFSAVQILLIISYASTLLQYLECLRVNLKLGPIPVMQLQYNPPVVLACALECCFHMLVLPPRISLQDRIYMNKTYSLLSLNDFLYVMILLRNYHTLQFLFWYSPFSTIRAHFFANLMDVSFNNLYVLRCYLASYSLKLVLGVYSAIVVVSGISLFVFEKGTPYPDFDAVEQGMWIVAYTQTTVGYGEITPVTYFGRLTLIISCFVGNFILSIIICLSSSNMSLNLTECTMYSEIVYAGVQRKYTKAAVLMIQKWWRLMLMRMHRTRNARTIVAFYSQLYAYRGVISTCQRVKDRRFERQIQAFEASTTKEFRSILEYVQPILVAETLTREIFRTEYQIKTKFRAIYKLTRKYRSKKREGAMSISSVMLTSPSPEPALFKVVSADGFSGGSKKRKGKVIASPLSNIKELAKAKVRAHQKLIGRLLKEDSLLDRPSIASSRSVSPFPGSYEL